MENSVEIYFIKAIQEGIESGVASDFSPGPHLQGLKAKKKLNGQVQISK
jgi:antitoxin ParD1/3/4